jgi:hypothetical protein
LSCDEHQHFPFAVVSLNLSTIVLRVLRTGKLHGSASRRGSVIEVCDDLYMALFYGEIGCKLND